MAFRGTGSWMLVAWSICLSALMGPPEAMAAVAEPKEYGTAIAFSFEDYRSMPHHAALAAAQADLSAQFPGGTGVSRITDFVVEIGGNCGWHGEPKHDDLTYCRYVQQVSGLSADGVQW